MDIYLPAGCLDKDCYFDLPSVGDAGEEVDEGMDEKEPDWDENKCSFCGAEQVGLFNGPQVSACQECERPVCSDCAEVDYDMVGDPGQYVCCQFDCPECIKG